MRFMNKLEFPLRTGLREYEKRDVEFIEKWMRDDGIRQWFTFASRPLAHEQIVQFVEDQINNKTQPKPTYKNFVIYSLNDAQKEYFGSVGLKNIDYQTAQAEITIVIADKSDLGKGYGQEALELICEYGFSILYLKMINIHCFAHNLRAINAYRKFGFSNEGLVHNNIKTESGNFDEIVMALDAEDYFSRKGILV